jgi:hypothetical protein
MPDTRGFVSAAGSWVRSQRASFALVGAVILGQLSRVLFETLWRNQVLTTGKPPLLAVIFLVLALVWLGVIIWARLRVGQELRSWARAWFARFAVADTIPRRYVIEDRGSLLAAALCGVLDLVLILVMQNTVREPLLMLAGVYTSPALADAAFVILVVVVALFVLSHMYRASTPVSAYLAWSVMDRLVPTAGFLAGPAPAPALAATRTGSRPAADQPSPGAATAVDADQTAVSEQRALAEQPSAAPSMSAEVTVRAPAADPEQTAVSERTVVAPNQSEEAEVTVVAEKQPNPTGDQR